MECLTSPNAHILVAIDELISQIGLCYVHTTDIDFVDIQQDLGSLAGYVYNFNEINLLHRTTKICKVAQYMNESNSNIPNFSIGSLNIQVAQMHVARSTCRRLEYIITNSDSNIPEIANYLAQVSSYLFYYAVFIENRS